MTLRATQLGMQTLAEMLDSASYLRATQLGMQALVEIPDSWSYLRATQIGMQVLAYETPQGRTVANKKKISGSTGQIHEVEAVTTDADGNELPSTDLTWETTDAAVATVVKGAGGKATVTLQGPGIAQIIARASSNAVAKIMTRVDWNYLPLPYTPTLILEADRGGYSDVGASVPVADTERAVRWHDEFWDSLWYNSDGAGPQYLVNRINGHPAMYFDAVGMRRLASAFNLTPPFTIAVIYAQRLANAQRRVLAGENANWLIGGYNGQHSWYGGDNWVANSDAPVTIGTPVLAIGTRADTDDAHFYVSGVEKTDSATAAFATTFELHIGGTGSQFSEAAGSDVALVAAFNKVLDADELQVFLDEATAKYAVVAAALPTTVTVTPDESEGPIGGTIQLAAEVRDQDGNVLAAEPVEWFSGDTSVATVDDTGLVTLEGDGECTIFATTEDDAATGTASVFAFGPGGSRRRKRNKMFFMGGDRRGG